MSELLSDQISSTSQQAPGKSAPAPEDSDSNESRRLDRAQPPRRRMFVAIFLVAALVGLLVWFVPFVPALYFNTITVPRLDAKGKPINVEVGPGTKQWVSIDKVSRHVVNAIVVAEDAKFYQHYGFDFEAIQKAIELNRKKGRYVRGASTISQQVIKMTFLSREKTLVRKMREATGTIVMELILPKDKILEWYINLCEFGGGIYGVKAAGQYYFKTRPELLTIEQAAHLAVVIPSPNKWSKGLRAKSLTPFGGRRFAHIITNLFMAGYITEIQKSTALARGNFGNPIAGYGGGDEDDCHGDHECEEGAGEGKGEISAPEDKGPTEPAAHVLGLEPAKKAEADRAALEPADLQKEVPISSPSPAAMTIPSASGPKKRERK